MVRAADNIWRDLFYKNYAEIMYIYFFKYLNHLKLLKTREHKKVESYIWIANV